jgi:hypothetical protein
MGRAIMESDRGPEMLYWLAKNPAEAQKIVEMVVPGAVFPAGHPLAGQAVPDVARQLRAMGRVEALVEAQAAPPKPEVKPVSQTPDPIKPLGSQAAATPKTADEESGDEYFARRTPELYKGRNAAAIH